MYFNAYRALKEQRKHHTAYSLSLSSSCTCETAWWLARQNLSLLRKVFGCDALPQSRSRLFDNLKCAHADRRSYVLIQEGGFNSFSVKTSARKMREKATSCSILVGETGNVKTIRSAGYLIDNKRKISTESGFWK